MADSSEEETVEKSTDELLSETDSLLSDLDGGDSDGEGNRPDATESTGSRATTDDAGLDLDVGTSTESATDTAGNDGGGWRSYFDPKSFLLATLLLTVGYVAGGFVPLLGGPASWVGLVGAAFAYGLGTSKRRYAESAVAGAGIGLVATVVTSLRFVAFLPAGEWLVAAGGAFGLVGGLVGYYFGRDLRNGLTSDPDEFEDDLSW